MNAPAMMIAVVVPSYFNVPRHLSKVSKRERQQLKAIDLPALKHECSMCCQLRKGQYVDFKILKSPSNTNMH